MREPQLPYPPKTESSVLYQPIITQIGVDLKTEHELTNGNVRYLNTGLQFATGQRPPQFWIDEDPNLRDLNYISLTHLNVWDEKVPLGDEPSVRIDLCLMDASASFVRGVASCFSELELGEIRSGVVDDTMAEGRDGDNYLKLDYQEYVSLVSADVAVSAWRNSNQLWCDNNLDITPSWVEPQPAESQRVSWDQRQETERPVRTYQCTEVASSDLNFPKCEYKLAPVVEMVGPMGTILQIRERAESSKHRIGTVPHLHELAREFRYVEVVGTNMETGGTRVIAAYGFRGDGRIGADEGSLTGSKASYINYQNRAVRSSDGMPPLDESFLRPEGNKRSDLNVFPLPKRKDGAFHAQIILASNTYGPNRLVSVESGFSVFGDVYFAYIAERGRPKPWEPAFAYFMNYCVSRSWIRTGLRLSPGGTPMVYPSDSQKYLPIRNSSNGALLPESITVIATVESRWRPQVQWNITIEQSFRPIPNGGPSNEITTWPPTDIWDVDPENEVWAPYTFYEQFKNAPQSQITEPWLDLEQPGLQAPLFGYGWVVPDSHRDAYLGTVVRATPSKSLVSEVPVFSHTMTWKQSDTWDGSTWSSGIENGGMLPRIALFETPASVSKGKYSDLSESKVGLKAVVNWVEFPLLFGSYSFSFLQGSVDDPPNVVNFDMAVDPWQQADLRTLRNGDNQISHTFIPWESEGLDEYFWIPKGVDLSYLPLGLCGQASSRTICEMLNDWWKTARGGEEAEPDYWFKPCKWGVGDTTLITTQEECLHNTVCKSCDQVADVLSCCFALSQGPDGTKCFYDTGKCIPWSSCEICNMTLSPEGCCNAAPSNCYFASGLTCEQMPEQCQDCDTEECCNVVSEGIGCRFEEDRCIPLSTECNQCNGKALPRNCCASIITEGVDCMTAPICPMFSVECCSLKPIKCSDCDYDTNPSWCCELIGSQCYHQSLTSACRTTPEMCMDCHLDEQPWACCNALKQSMNCSWDNEMCVGDSKTLCALCNEVEFASECCQSREGECVLYKVEEAVGVCDEVPKRCEDCNLSPFPGYCCNVLLGAMCHWVGNGCLTELPVYPTDCGRRHTAVVYISGVLFFLSVYITAAVGYYIEHRKNITMFDQRHR